MTNVTNMYRWFDNPDIVLLNDSIYYHFSLTMQILNILVYALPWLFTGSSFIVAVCGTPIGALSIFFIFTVLTLFCTKHSNLLPLPSSDPVKSFTSVIALQKNLWPQSQSELLALAVLKSIFYLFCPLNYTGLSTNVWPQPQTGHWQSDRQNLICSLLLTWS